MRWFIIFFSIALLGIVLAEDVEIQVESPVTRTYEGSEEGFSFSWEYILISLGVVIFVFCLFLFLRLRRKKKQVKKSTKKGFSFFSFFKRDKEERILGIIEKYSRQEVQDKKRLQDAIDEAYTLQDKQEELLKIKEDIKQEYPKLLDEDVKRVLKVTDDLLGQMPETVVDSFVHSPDFDLYKKVMKKVHEPLKPHTEELEKLEKVLDLLEKGAITGDEARNMLGLPVRYLQAQKIEKKDKEQVLQELKKVRDEKN